MTTNKSEINKPKFKGIFILEDLYLDEYAQVCGRYATLAYISLCRHRGKQKEYSFPKISYIASKHGVCEEVITDGIKILEQWNIIEVKRIRDKWGHKKNYYKVLDKSLWKPMKNQAAKKKLAQPDINDLANQTDSSWPTRQNSSSQPDNIGIKETQKEGNTIKETNISNASVAGKGVNSIIGIFARINPTINWKNKTIREACEEMIEKFGLEETKNMAQAVISVQGEKYAPVAVNPYQMKEKLAQFKFYFQRHHNNSSILKI